MQYRIEENEGIFTPQYKWMLWWVDFGFSYNNKEMALKQIKEHHKYHNDDTEPRFHYVSPEDLL